MHQVRKGESLSVIFEEKKKEVSPGCDGYTLAFYKHFWEILDDILVNLFNFIAETGNIGIDARRSVIKLIPKIKHPAFIYLF